MNVAIDAQNLAYWADRTPTLRVALGVAAALQRRGDTVVLFFDATLRHRYPDEADSAAALDAAEAGVVVAPSGVPADRLLLRHARKSGAVIVSRDRFRDHRQRFRRLIDDPERRVDGFVADDAVQVPRLALVASLPATAAAALAAWRAARGTGGTP